MSFNPLLEEPRQRWSSFGLSFLAQMIAVVLLAVFSLFQTPELLSLRDFGHIELVPPLSREVAAAEPPAKAPRRAIREVPTPTAIKSESAPTVPAAALPALPEFEPQPPRLAANKNVLAVQTGVLTSAGSSAQVTLAKPPRAVQTGGFGDPEGVPASVNGSSKSVVAKVGDFDLPSGPGTGNGWGGARGARGTVASTGFGNGVAVHSSAALPRPAASVRRAGFDNVQPVSHVVRPKPAAPADVLPVLILEKPKPVYTEEARKLGLEGEVLLEVVFTASGDLRVVQVVRGLGHGLDDAAIRAAKRIRFTPATREGRAIDFQARLHIVFQLS
jgi:TonB family protein